MERVARGLVEHSTNKYQISTTANFGTGGLHNIPWARFVTVGARCLLYSILRQPSQSGPRQCTW
eukprot:COSAG02_NODE_35853_length_462_cov_1.044077_1_plen_63_part_10